MPDKTIQEEAGLNPDQWKVIDVPPINPSQMGVAPIPNPTGSYYSGSLSGVLQHDVQLVNTQYQTPRISSTPLMPLSFSGLANANSAAQSVSRSISQQVVNETFTSNAVELQTNGTDNSVQNKLNLTSGSGGINLTQGSGGMVTIAESVMGASGPSHAAGAVPDPGPIAGTSKFLREDGTFVAPSSVTLENNSVLNSSQTLLNLTAGSGATITDNGGGNIEIAATGSTNPAVVQLNNQPFSGNTTISDTLTSIQTLSVTAPVSGGPFRALVSYTCHLNFQGFSNVNGFTLYVSDGVHQFAGYSSGQSNASSGASTGATCCMFAPTTYANGASVTFTLYGITYTGGGAVVEQNSIQSGPGSDFQVTFLTSL